MTGWVCYGSSSASPPRFRGELRAVGSVWKLVVLLIGLWLIATAPACAQKSRRKPPPKPADQPAPRALSRADSLVLRARTLVEKRQEAEALIMCRRALSYNPFQYEALWRASVLGSHIGARYSDETRQQQYFDTAQIRAANALIIHPTFATANYAMALALANGGSLLPLRGRLAARLDEKPYLDAALLDEPHHADAWQLLARWYFKTANYTVFESLASKVLLGRIPHGTTNELAVAAIRRAIELNPARVNYYYDLARMSLLKGRQQVAIQALAEGTQHADIVTTEDLAVSRQMERLLHQLQRRHRVRGPELEPR